MKNWPKIIDHTWLKKTGLSLFEQRKKIAKLCLEAHHQEAYAVCVPLEWISLARVWRDELKSHFQIAAVIGFPLGDIYSTSQKLRQVEAALKEGVDEIDMVVNYQQFQHKQMGLLSYDLQMISKMVGHLPLKIITENAMLSTEEKAPLYTFIYEMIEKYPHGRRFLKTSTGFAPKANSYTFVQLVEDLKLMQKCTRGEWGLKASGGISSEKQLDYLAQQIPQFKSLNPELVRIGSANLLASNQFNNSY